VLAFKNEITPVVPEAPKTVENKEVDRQGLDSLPSVK